MNIPFDKTLTTDNFEEKLKMYLFKMEYKLSKGDKVRINEKYISIYEDIISNYDELKNNEYQNILDCDFIIEQCPCYLTIIDDKVLPFISAFSSNNKNGFIFYFPICVLDAANKNDKKLQIILIVNRMSCPICDNKLKVNIFENGNHFRFTCENSDHSFTYRHEPFYKQHFFLVKHKDFEIKGNFLNNGTLQNNSLEWREIGGKIWASYNCNKNFPHEDMKFYFEKLNKVGIFI